MKNFFFAFALFAGFPLSAQTEKGATPLSPAHPLTLSPAVTRAVVIGISDYQDEAIPDLRFADRDAEAFTAWLRSPAGGSLPDNQIKVLTNKNATTGKMIAALDGLIVASKPGDEAIIYFSGHGDVERVTKFQRGFLLTYDSPPAVYAAGAFSLQYLQDIVTTLSEAEVQAVVITDACRAGKLAGSEFGGSKATSAALAQQFANEVKILSCQPDEFSLEGEQWGGGRGCFSYHLVDALYGMADSNKDGTVNLLELGRYLEDKVTTEAAPQSQIPFTVGSKATRLATVDTEALAQWRQQKDGEALAFKKIDSRGLEDLALAKADTGVLEMYHAFTAALDAGNLMAADSTERKSADDYYKLLVQEPSIAELHGLMTRNFAAALMDEGQQFINRLLKSDPEVVNAMYSKGSVDFGSIHLKLRRAAELLGQKHYAYKTLKAKEFYFNAGTEPVEYYRGIMEDSLPKAQKQIWLTGLGYDQEAPYLLCRLLAFYELDSFKIKASRLEELAPKWALGFDDIAYGYLMRGEFALSVEYYKKAIAADSAYLYAYTWLAQVLDVVREYVEVKKWRSLAVEKYQERMASGTFSPTDYGDLGGALYQLRRYKEAEKMLLAGDRIAEGKAPATFLYLGQTYCDMGRFEDAIAQFSRDNYWQSYSGSIYQYYLNDLDKAETAFRNAMSGDPEMQMGAQFQMGMLYFQKKEYEAAAQLFEKLLKEIPTNKTGWFWLAEANRHLGNAQKVREANQKLLELSNPVFQRHANSRPEYLYRMLALSRLGKNVELQECVQQATDSLNDDPWFHYNMACFYSMTDEPEKALDQLKKAEELGWEPNPALWNFGNAITPLLDPLRSLPAFQAWEQRWLPPYKDYSKE